jgi:CAAX protease family protein
MTGGRLGTPDFTIRWWHGVVFFMAAAGVQSALIGLLTIAQVLGLLGTTAKQIQDSLFSPTMVAAQVVFTCSLFTALAIGSTRLFGLRPVEWLRLKGAPPAVFFCAAVGVAAVGILADQTIFFLHSLWPGVFNAAQLEDFAKVFAHAGTFWFIVLTLVVTIGPGIGEELFFRGFILRAFRKDISAVPAVLLTAVLFGLIHMDWLQGVGAGIIGVYLGFIALRSGSLWPAVVAHAINNLISAIYSRYDAAGAAVAWYEGHPSWLLLAAASVLGAMIFAIIKLTKKEEIRGDSTGTESERKPGR